MQKKWRVKFTKSNGHLKCV